MERENNIDRQHLAAFGQASAGGGSKVDESHAAGRIHYGTDGGRPTRALLDSLAAAIPKWSKEAITYCVVAEGGDPFCVGWDMPQLLTGDAAEVRETLAASYAMAWQIECFTKPSIPLIDGEVAGAGVAFTLYGTHRVAGPRYRLSVPALSQGWFPDHGLTYALAQLPGSVGTYLALTGASLGRADAYRLGLVTHCIAADAFPGIVARLSDADPVDPILDGLNEPMDAGELAALGEVIAQCFAADSIEAILDRLSQVRGRDADWAAKTRAVIAAAPALPAALTLRLLRESRHGDLREALIRDFRVACRLIGRGDRMAVGSGVPAQMLADMLSSLGAQDLQLSTRAEMQAPAL